MAHTRPKVEEALLRERNHGLSEAEKAINTPALSDPLFQGLLSAVIESGAIMKHAGDVVARSVLQRGVVDAFAQGVDVGALGQLTPDFDARAVAERLAQPITEAIRGGRAYKEAMASFAKTYARLSPPALGSDIWQGLTESSQILQSIAGVHDVNTKQALAGAAQRALAASLRHRPDAANRLAGLAASSAGEEFDRQLIMDACEIVSSDELTGEAMGAEGFAWHSESGRAAADVYTESVRRSVGKSVFRRLMDLVKAVPTSAPRATVLALAICLGSLNAAGPATVKPIIAIEAVVDGAQGVIDADRIARELRMERHIRVYAKTVVAAKTEWIPLIEAKIIPNLGKYFLLGIDWIGRGLTAWWIWTLIESGVRKFRKKTIKPVPRDSDGNLWK